MTIAIDFDGTIVTHEYPNIGKPVPGAIQSIKALKQSGHQIALWTMRSGSKLDEAVQYCRDNGIEFDYVNSNPTQLGWTSSPKLYAKFYIDDAAIGCPLIYPWKGRPYVDWYRVMELFAMRTMEKAA